MYRLQRSVRAVHGWAGAAFTLYLLVISLSGTVLLWKQAYLWLAIPEARADFEPTPEAHYAFVAADGTIIDEWVLNERWEEWLYDLHHRLLLGDSGLSLTGSAGLVLAFPGWFDSTLEPMRRNQAYSDAMVVGIDTVSGAATGDWLPALQRAQASFPDGTIRTTAVANDFDTYRVIGIQQDEDWHPLGSSKIYIDAPEGYMDVRIDATVLPTLERAFNAAYPLHTGRLNLPYRLLMTASGLGLVLASIFGLLGFLGRFRKGP